MPNKLEIDQSYLHQRSVFVLTENVPTAESLHHSVNIQMAVAPHPSAHHNQVHHTN